MRTMMNGPKIRIDHERYGDCAGEFESCEDAEREFRALGDDFVATRFVVRGDHIVDETGEVVGEVRV